MVEDCMSSNCRICQKKHNSLLHVNRNSGDKQIDSKPNTEESGVEKKTRIVSYVVMFI